MRRKAKVIQVPMPPDLLSELDEVSHERGESRASLIREACARYIASAKEAELVRRYVEGYTRNPEPVTGQEWRLELAGEIWGEEDWNEEDW